MCDAIPMPKKKPSDQQAHDRRHQERMRAKKQAKKPRREDVNQAAARIVREATEKASLVRDLFFPSLIVRDTYDIQVQEHFDGIRV